MEKTLVTQDWFELFIAQDIVLDTLINDLYYNQLDQWLRDNGARDVSMLTEFMKERAKESERWSNAVLKVVIAESTTNAAQIKSWISNWRIKAQEALAPLAEELLNDQALADAFSVLEKRLSKSGLGS
jgi:phenol hydroxylase P1 protein